MFLLASHTCASDTSFFNLIIRLCLNDHYVMPGTLQDTCTTCRMQLPMLSASTSSDILLGLVVTFLESHSGAHQIEIRILLTWTVRFE